MLPEERYKIISEDYIEFIVKYNGDPISLRQFQQYSAQTLNELFAMAYLPVSQVTSDFIARYGYSGLPHCYGLCSAQSLEASGIVRLRRSPALNLLGKDIIVGIIDTGIDYTHPVFRKRDGTSKIISIWDQSIDSGDGYPVPYFFGTEYTVEQINLALQVEDPLSIVPSMDELGHGTMLAGIAAGSEDAGNNFSGVVPESELIIVKLKQAKNNLKNFYFIPPDVPCYQENDIMWALQYIVNAARSLRRPVAICIGLGTSQGPHDNSDALNMTASMVGDFSGVAVTVAAGNEGNSRRHFYSTIVPGGEPVSVELNVGEEQGFTLEFWGDPPAIYTLDISSPGGEYVPRLQERLVGNQEISLFFEETLIHIDYIMVETETGKQVILLRFKNPAPGLWTFRVYARGDIRGSFHIWLPSGEFITTDTFFQNGTASTTITSPGNSLVPITASAYNSMTNSIYQESGRGFSTNNIINPDLAAPGVNLQCPDLNHGYTSVTGTGAAAAHTAGITAMMLEWSIVRNNFPGLDTVGIKKFLIRGAARSNRYRYPDQSWGYGSVDIYNSFDLLRSEIFGRING